MTSARRPSIESKVHFIADLLASGRFQVPWHQRFYDWNAEHVRELLDDIEEAHDEGRTSYFLGSIMLIPRGDSLEINDGQQRMMTLSLIFAAFSRYFDNSIHPDRNRRDISLKTLFEFPVAQNIDSANLEKGIPRLTPPRSDRSRFYQIIRGHDVGTNGKLTSAWSNIISFISRLDRKRAAALFDFITEKVEISILYVPETEDASAVFEALNARGKSLEDIDLIRNHLYSYFSKSASSQKYEAIHTKIEEALATLRTPKRAQEYFRCYLQNRYGYLQKTRFYRSARIAIARTMSDSPSSQDKKNHVFFLVDDLTDLKNVELFRTLFSTTPSPEFLQDFRNASRTSNSKRSLSIFLEELRGYTVAYPLLFALLRRFASAAAQQSALRRATAKAVHRSIADLTAFVMRTSFIEGKFEPSRVEAALAKSAQRIAARIGHGEVDDLCILEDLAACDGSQIMTDAHFVERLKNVRITNLPKARRLLFGVNARMQRDATALSYSGCSVEHVLPKSQEYWPGWTEFTGVGPDLTDWAQRLGNLTLLGLSGGYSRGRFNMSFESKRPSFEDSPFAITKELATHSQWSPTAVNERSQRIAQAAAHVWQFSRPTPSA